MDDDWIQQNELLDVANDLLESSTEFAGKAFKSKGVVAAVRPPALIPAPKLIPAPTLVAKLPPPVIIRTKPNINITNHVVIKGIKSESVSDLTKHIGISRVSANNSINRFRL